MHKLGLKMISYLYYVGESMGEIVYSLLELMQQFSLVLVLCLHHGLLSV